MHVDKYVFLHLVNEFLCSVSTSLLRSLEQKGAVLAFRSVKASHFVNVDLICFSSHHTW